MAIVPQRLTSRPPQPMTSKPASQPDRNVSTGSALHLVLQIGDSAHRPLTVPLRPRLVLGRAGLDDGTEQPNLDLTPFEAEPLGVSRLHAAILYQDRQLHIEDLGSRNGTRVNGLPIPPHTPVRVRSGDELELGQLRVTLRLVHLPV